MRTTGNYTSFFPTGKNIPKQTKVNFPVTAMVPTSGALIFILQDLKEKLN